MTNDQPTPFVPYSDPDWAATFATPMSSKAALNEILAIRADIPSNMDDYPLPVDYTAIAQLLHSHRARLWWRDRMRQVCNAWGWPDLTAPASELKPWHAPPYTFDTAWIVELWNRAD